MFKLKSKALTATQSVLLQKSDSLVTTFSASLTSELHDLSSDYDLLNLHATYNVLDARGISQLAEKIPLVLTLHDQRWITGGCHYAWNCEGFLFDCSRCPQVRKPFRRLPQRHLTQVKSYLQGGANIQLVAPSMWLAREVSRSSLFRNHKVKVIPNPIPLPPQEEGPLRKTLVTEDRLCVGFISKDLHNPYKGLQVLIQALEEVSQNRQVALYLFGEGEAPKIKGNVSVYMSQFNTDNARFSSIGSCDVVVIPSYQDNSPSVLGECLVAGIPVIVSSAGGLLEVAKEMELPLFEPGDWKELARRLIQHSGERLSEKWVGYARKKYSAETCSSAYQDLYESTISRFHEN